MLPWIKIEWLRTNEEKNRGKIEHERELVRRKREFLKNLEKDLNSKIEWQKRYESNLQTANEELNQLQLDFKEFKDSNI